LRLFLILTRYIYIYMYISTVKQWVLFIMINICNGFLDQSAYIKIILLTINFIYRIIFFVFYLIQGIYKNIFDNEISLFYIFFLWYLIDCYDTILYIYNISNFLFCVQEAVTVMMIIKKKYRIMKFHYQICFYKCLESDKIQKKLFCK
jgi:hypothetical protein